METAITQMTKDKAWNSIYLEILKYAKDREKEPSMIRFKCYASQCAMAAEIIHKHYSSNATWYFLPPGQGKTFINCHIIRYLRTLDKNRKCIMVTINSTLVAAARDVAEEAFGFKDD